MKIYPFSKGRREKKEINQIYSGKAFTKKEKQPLRVEKRKIRKIQKRWTIPLVRISMLAYIH